jgi:hypothetical protein
MTSQRRREKVVGGSAVLHPSRSRHYSAAECSNDLQPELVPCQLVPLAAVCAGVEGLQKFRGGPRSSAFPPLSNCRPLYFDFAVADCWGRLWGMLHCPRVSF